MTRRWRRAGARRCSPYGLRVLATLALLITAAALTASPALARDRDRLPDRWERKHHLNLKKNDARRDRDRDGLSNLREYRAHTNPRKKDSDRDRLRDGAELRFGFTPAIATPTTTAPRTAARTPARSRSSPAPRSRSSWRPASGSPPASATTCP